MVDDVYVCFLEINDLLIMTLFFLLILCMLSLASLGGLGRVLFHPEGFFADRYPCYSQFNCRGESRVVSTLFSFIQIFVSLCSDVLMGVGTLSVYISDDIGNSWSETHNLYLDPWIHVVRGIPRLDLVPPKVRFQDSSIQFSGWLTLKPTRHSITG